MNQLKFWTFVGLAFLAPVCGVVAMNWESVKPYLFVDVKTAKGKVLYFYADT